jgi:hypothetical protein
MEWEVVEMRCPYLEICCCLLLLLFILLLTLLLLLLLKVDPSSWISGRSLLSDGLSAFTALRQQSNHHSDLCMSSQRLSINIFRILHCPLRHPIFWLQSKQPCLCRHCGLCWSSKIAWLIIIIDRAGENCLWGGFHVSVTCHHFYLSVS